MVTFWHGEMTLVQEKPILITLCKGMLAVFVGVAHSWLMVQSIQI